MASAPLMNNQPMSDNPMVSNGQVAFTTINTASSPYDRQPYVQQFRDQHEVNPNYLPLIYKLCNYTTILVCDDSGSMRELADPDVGGTVTRWEELKKTVRIVIDAHEALNVPLDIYFINRGYIRSVMNWAQVAPYFQSEPSGGTNLLNILQMIQANSIGVDMGKPLIIHIFTDGHPTAANGREDFPGLANWIRNRPLPTKVFISIILCTDDEEIERGYRRLETRTRGRGVPGVDVSEDYRGESRDIRRTRGRSYRFTYGDYVMKVLVGAIDPTIHNIDLPDSCCGCVVN